MRGSFFDALQNYCVQLAASAERQQDGASRLIWYATLALLRCVASSPAAEPLLDARPSTDLGSAAATRELLQALSFLKDQADVLEALATERAQTLLADHRRVREAARDVRQYVVRASLPVDVLGVHVLLPEAL